MEDIEQIIKALDSEIKKRGVPFLTPPQANKILDELGILSDDKNRPGLPLRNLLRDQLLPYCYQINGKWRIPHSSQNQSTETENLEELPVHKKNSIKKYLRVGIACFIIIYLIFVVRYAIQKEVIKPTYSEKTLNDNIGNNTLSTISENQLSKTSNDLTSQAETPIDYTIIKKSESISEYYRMSIFNADIRISRKLTEAELKTLSYKLKSEILTKAKDIRYFFYLPEMEVDNGAWATTLFKPDYSFRIIGKSLENQQSINSYIKNSNDELIGQWVDNGDATDIIYQLKKDKEKGFLLQVFSPSENDRATLATLKKTIRDKKTTFVDMEEPTHYYVLEENGDLSSFDKLGFIFTMKKVE